jgi:hydroxyacylglutathione hydrolase
LKRTNNKNVFAFKGLGLEVLILSVLHDNYIYMIRKDEEIAVVDPGVAEPVVDFLKENRLKLALILCTHHHYDHVGGLSTLKGLTRCSVVGPEDSRLPGVDRVVGEGDTLHFGPTECTVFQVPGHTKSHLAYYFNGEGILFTGDCLFSGGCGRIFEGTPAQMWRSLERLSALHGRTKIFPGHEYTMENMEFAASVEPDNEKVLERLGQVRLLYRQRQRAVPSTLSEERITNPFLRVGEAGLRKALGQNTDSADSEVFALLRKMKDSF